VRLTLYPTPIPLKDLQSIQQMLAKDDLICSAFPLARMNVYDCFSFLKQKDLYGTDTCFILDRNIFTRIVSLARGETVSRKTKEAEDAYRIAAGALSFFQCCNALVEPCMPLLEEASVANEELQLFRKADNIMPQYFADIALGRCDRLEPNLTRKSELDQTEELSELPMWWTINYALALKLAMLELESVSQRTKLEQFLEWLHQDYVWSASAVLFATIYLSPKRKHGMLKRLRAKDRAIALNGIKNAVWDMTLLTMWSGKCHFARGTNRIWFLCSRDEAVKMIARSLVSTEASAERLKQIFVNYWGQHDGDALNKQYWQLTAKLKDPTRRKMRVPTSDPIWSQIPQELEREFLQQVIEA
jgi:hypothetical protein